MIKLFGLWFSVVFFLGSFQVNATDLETLRLNYANFVSDKSLCKKTIAELLLQKEESTLHLGYLGYLQTIWANHVLNPVSKLSTFKEGKQNIEQAIKNDPENVELRFIRLSVQKNAPSFLGYRSDIEQDINFIKQNRHLLEAVILNKTIDDILVIKK